MFYIDFNSVEHYVPVFGTGFPQNMSYLQRVLNNIVIPTFFSLISDIWAKPIVAVSKG